MTAQRIIILVLMMFNAMGGGKTQNTIPDALPETKQDTAYYQPTGLDGVDSMNKKNIKIDKKIVEFKANLQMELAKSKSEAAYWKRIALQAQCEIVAAKTMIKTDTIIATPNYPVVKEVYKGLVPIKSKSWSPIQVKVKIGRNTTPTENDVKTEFRDSIRITMDTASVIGWFTYSRKN